MKGIAPDLFLPKAFFECLPIVAMKIGMAALLLPYRISLWLLETMQ